MDPLKALTGKNPAEFEPVAKVLVDTPDVELFKKLVKQDDFLFDFVKVNVAKRIQKACNANNYRNLFKFFEFYSSFYDEVIAEVLCKYGDEETLNKIENILYFGSDNAKAYALKFLAFSDNEKVVPYVEEIRKLALDEYEPININAVEVLSKIGDKTSKQDALKRLNSEDAFEQYNAVKFLVGFQAKDALSKIVDVMKKSSLAENIASEIPYLVPFEELIQEDENTAYLILCNIISAIPDILDPSVVFDYNLSEILEILYYEKLNSASALVLRIAQDKFNTLTENEEYLFDCDKNTKDEIYNIQKFLEQINTNKLNSLLYDELYEESDFILFAIDYVNDVEELETLLDSKNTTVLLKILSVLKEKNFLKPEHKLKAKMNISNQDVLSIIDAM